MNKMSKRVSTEIEQQAIEMYYKGFTYNQIIEALAIGSGTVSRIFRRYEIQLTRASNKKTSLDKEAAAIEMYMQDIPLKTIASQLEINEMTVNRIIKRNGYELNRGYGVTRKHSIEREDFFEEIATEEQAYFLGWMISDGSVKSSLEGIEITVVPGDDYILKKFCKCLGTEKPLEKMIRHRDGKDWQYSRITIFSKRIVNSLIKLGVTPAKTSKTIYPPLVNDARIHSAMIRGLLDGEGCVFINSRGQGRTFYLLGTNSLMTDAATALTKYCGVKPKAPLKSNWEHLYRLAYHSRSELAAIHNFLYQDASPDLILQRKKEKFDTILNSYIDKL